MKHLSHASGRVRLIIKQFEELEWKIFCRNS